MTNYIADACQAFVGAWTMMIVGGGDEYQARVELRDATLYLHATRIVGDKVLNYGYAQPMVDIASMRVDWRALGELKGQHMVECLSSGRTTP